MNHELDVLFLHTGMDNVYQVFPMGVFGMLQQVNAAGLRGRVVSLDIERSVDPAFSLAALLDRYRPHVICLDLHWYVHSYCQLELARQVRGLSDAPIILGGFTASCFAEEIIRDHSFITGVLRGEADQSLLALLRAATPADWAHVPGLVYRRGDKIVANDIVPPDPAVLDTITYADLSVLDHYEHYISTASSHGPVIFVYPRQVPKKAYFLPIGRGCSVNCSYCTAAHRSVKQLFKRSRCYYRPIDAVVDDFARLAAEGVETVLVEYYPAPANDDYFEELFARVRERKLDIGINFGAWTLPSPRFVDAYAKTFNQELSCLSFSPESGSERVRQLNKGKAYPNEDVYRTVSLLAEKNVMASVHFGFGFPGEDWPEFDETLAMFRRLQSSPFYLSIRGIPLEPGSPMFLQPDKYGIRRFWTTFADYYQTYRDLHEGRTPAHPFGYETDILSEADMSRMKIKAYRAFYLNWRFIRQRLAWVGGPFSGPGKYIQWGLATLLGLPNVLNRLER